MCEASAWVAVREVRLRALFSSEEKKCGNQVASWPNVKYEGGLRRGEGSSAALCWQLGPVLAPSRARKRATMKAALFALPKTKILTDDERR